MAYAYAHSFQMPIFQCISMNVLGERQHPEKFIPKTIKAIFENRPVLIHGVPGKISSRCWLHARNLADAHLFLFDKAEPEQSYNVVGEERSALELANRAAKIIKGRELNEDEIEYFDFHSLRPGHDFRYALDGSKIAQMGWEAPLTLEQSFDKMVKWMIDHMQDEEGYFYYRIGRWVPNKIPFMRWAQAWAFFALTNYLSYLRGKN